MRSSVRLRPSGSVADYPRGHPGLEGPGEQADGRVLEEHPRGGDDAEESSLICDRTSSMASGSIA